VLGTPPQPVDLTAFSNSDSIILYWRDEPVNHDGELIYRCDGSVAGQEYDGKRIPAINPQQPDQSTCPLYTSTWGLSAHQHVLIEDSTKVKRGIRYCYYVVSFDADVWPPLLPGVWGIKGVSPASRVMCRVPGLDDVHPGIERDPTNIEDFNEPFVDQYQVPHRLYAVNVQPLVPGSSTSVRSQDDYDAITAKGFNAVRMVLHWDLMEPAQNCFDTCTTTALNGAQAKDNWAALRRNIQWAGGAMIDRNGQNPQRKPLYVILSPIAEHEGSASPAGSDYFPSWARSSSNCPISTASAILNSCARGYLETIARLYNLDDRVAAYDPISDPRPSGSPINQQIWTDYNTLSGWMRPSNPDVAPQDSWDKTGVYAMDPAHTIQLLEPAYGDASIVPGCGDPSSQASFTRENRFVYSPHFYFAGLNNDSLGNESSTLDGAGYTTNCDQDKTNYHYTYETGPEGYSNIDIGVLEHHIALHLNRLQRAKAPIPTWIGELGIQSGAANHDQWIKDVVYTLKKYGLGYAWWQYFEGGTGFSLASSAGTSVVWNAFTDLLFQQTGQSAGPDIGGNPVIAAAGDTSPSNTGTAGDDETRHTITASVNPTLVLHLGDLQYPVGDTSSSTSAFNANYARSWGQLGYKTYTTFGGSHDCLGLSDATPLSSCGSTNWTTGMTHNLHSFFNTYGPRQQVDGAEVYAFTFGNWRLISVPSYCLNSASACSPTSKDQVLADLRQQAHDAQIAGQCALAFWHQPYYTSGTSTHHAVGPNGSTSGSPRIFEDDSYPDSQNNDREDEAVQALYDEQVDLLLVGHQHNYERWKPMNPYTNAVDTDATGQGDGKYGVTEVTVGTGGNGFYPWETSFNSTYEDARYAGSTQLNGVLKLTLNQTYAELAFVPSVNSAYTDSTRIDCH
jgi:hypothetical protein